jgi:outer membrane protein assembly factor BamB
MRPALATMVLSSAAIAGCGGQSAIGDGCGNDISGHRSVVHAYDVETGRQVWATDVPHDDGYLIAVDATHVRVPTHARSSDTILDVLTGHRTGTEAQPPPSATSRADYPGWDVTSGDLHIVADFITESGSSLTATRISTAEPAWTVRLLSREDARDLRTRSRPLLVGDRVLIAVGDAMPTCA